MVICNKHEVIPPDHEYIVPVRIKPANRRIQVGLRVDPVPVVAIPERTRISV